MAERGTLGVARICCLLHNLIPGGSGWQWVHLLGQHVGAGGEATIVAPPGLLSGPAAAAGIELVEIDWEQRTVAGEDGLLHLVGGHDAVVVPWDHRVMEAFGPALNACGRGALVVHQGPTALARWLPADQVTATRRPLVRALLDPRAVALVRGESHRGRMADAFAIDAAGLDVLPASIPLASIPYQPRAGEPVELLALMRLSPEKAAIAELAVALTRARLAQGRRCRLTIAGEGVWRAEARALCEAALPAGSWRLEPAPPDPIARLAAADVIVAQGLTTLEAAALGRRVVVARAGTEGGGPSGAVLGRDNYDEAARDPFGWPAVSQDAASLWGRVEQTGNGALAAVRHQVEQHNSLEASARALAGALARTAP